jgi:two-component system response regulator RegX3
MNNVSASATGSCTVLLVEDEDSFAEALRVALKREGFRVLVAEDGVTALDQFETDPPDIVLLDVMLPRMSGIDVCRAIRKQSAVPIIMVSARDEDVDAIVGLEVGADDYVKKPFSSRELIARIRANLRRTPAAPAEVPTGAVEAAGVVVDPDKHEVIVRGEKVDMPLKEFELLYLLVENAGRVVTRETIIDRVWGHGYVGDTKTVDVHIRRLRAKVEPDLAHPSLITTIRGLGYRFEVEPSART